MPRFFTLLVLIAFLSPTINEAQEKKEIRITGSFKNMALSQFFDKLETLAPVIFYYDTTKLDSVPVDLNADNELLSALLDRALKDRNILYSIDNKNNVYITSGIHIVTTLPADLFPSPETIKTAKQSVPDTIVDYGLSQQKKKQLVSENKLYDIGSKSSQAKGPAILTGNIRNARSGEPLVNASVFIDSKAATTTDAYGHYSLSVAPGKYTLNILAIGMRDTKLQLAVYSDGKLDADIPEQVTTLREVIVAGQKTKNISTVNMGVQRLTIEAIRKIPTVFGEADILRAITSLPGVKTVGEASTGFNVRGGSADQNLILYNESTIYNPAHFFGIFSAFNPDLINDVELYKSSIPAKYGGRLSSVLDINSREGNKKTYAGTAGIGPVTSRVHLEGPIVKDKTSFIFGARATYADWLLGILPDNYKNSKAAFQDINLAISHKIDSNNSIYISGYYSNDRFALNSDTVYNYSNRNLSIKWKTSLTKRLSAEVIAGADQYQYNVTSDQDKEAAFKLKFSIQQLFAKINFVYYRNLQHSFDFGVSSIRYKLNPGEYEPLNEGSLIIKEKVDNEQAQESAAYITHRFTPSNKFSFSTGLRYSIYNYLGPHNVNYYAVGLPITEATRLETKEYSKGKIIKTYGAPEIRFSARYSINPTFSIKLGYNSQRQYIHTLSNTAAIAPTDIWKLSDPNIKPQQGQQVSFGIYKNLKSNTIETSVEVYYKDIKDYLDYKPGATLLLNKTIETEVISTKGKAYGLELLLKKAAGKLNGWISYTYSRILLRSLDNDPAAQVNNGAYYPANYDKPHDFTFTGNYRVNHRFSISVSSTYSTGRPITLPIGRYYYGNSQRVLYSGRNEYRIPNYARTDLSLNIDGNHKVTHKTHNSWTIGAYNLLGRKNAYSVYFVSENGFINGYKLSIFGSIIPFINYNIRF